MFLCDSRSAPRFLLPNTYHKMPQKLIMNSVNDSGLVFSNLVNHISHSMFFPFVSG